MDEITLKSRACFFAGENGTGKSTLLEAIASFNTVLHPDALDKEAAYSPPISDFHGGRSLHTRFHGGAQFIISNHSPILLGYPKAQILSFDDGQIHEIEYEETAPLQIVRRFVNDRKKVSGRTVGETPTFFRAGDFV